MTDEDKLPLQEILKGVSIDSELKIALDALRTLHIPVGKYCHDAANVIEAMQKREETLVQALETSLDAANDEFGVAKKECNSKDINFWGNLINQIEAALKFIKE